MSGNHQPFVLQSVAGFECCLVQGNKKWTNLPKKRHPGGGKPQRGCPGTNTQPGQMGLCGGSTSFPPQGRRSNSSMPFDARSQPTHGLALDPPTHPPIAPLRKEGREGGCKPRETTTEQVGQDCGQDWHFPVMTIFPSYKCWGLQVMRVTSDEGLDERTNRHQLPPSCLNPSSG